MGYIRWSWTRTRGSEEERGLIGIGHRLAHWLIIEWYNTVGILSLETRNSFLSGQLSTWRPGLQSLPYVLLALAPPGEVPLETSTNHSIFFNEQFDYRHGWNGRLFPISVYLLAISSSFLGSSFYGSLSLGGVGYVALLVYIPDRSVDISWFTQAQKITVVSVEEWFWRRYVLLP